MNSEETKAKQAVKQITSENITSYPNHWFEGDLTPQEFAEQLFENRNEHETERDENGGVTFEDYHNWVTEEWERHLEMDDALNQ